jgi:transposase-like protein
VCAQRFSSAGHAGDGQQRCCCSGCQDCQTARSSSAFAGYRFPDDIIALAVRWYLHYRLPYANVAELLAERGVYVDASTILDWVQRFAPLYQEAAPPHREQVRGKWSIDETYIKVAGVPCSVFRASDAWGQVIDVYVSPTRDAAAATSFLRRAVKETSVRPHTATTDKASIYPPALAVVLPETQHVTGKLEQQEIERDHQHLKGRYRSMRGFKQLRCAQVICAGHGFVRNLRNGCYRLGLVLSDRCRLRGSQTMRAWDEITRVLQAAKASGRSWPSAPQRDAPHQTSREPNGT